MNVAYRKTMSAIGLGMLLFLVAFNALATAFVLIFRLFEKNLSEVGYEVAYQLIYGVVYLLSFILPGLYIRHRLKRTGFEVAPVQSSLRLSPYLPFMIFATVTVVLVVANVNAALVEVFNYTTYSNEVFWDSTLTENYQVVLEFITLCVVPGVCEEFLFRGVILQNLRPFGEGKAILISSLLFAFMHQNAGQFFYTFCAGILLGLIYVKTGNIWNATVVHLMNNFFSSAENVMIQRLSGQFGDTVVLLFEAVVFLLGTVSIVVLIVKAFKPADVSDGFFEKEPPPRDGYALSPVSYRETVKGFLRPSIVVFALVSFIEMIFYLIQAVNYVG